MGGSMSQTTLVRMHAREGTIHELVAYIGPAQSMQPNTTGGSMGLEAQAELLGQMHQPMALRLEAATVVVNRWVCLGGPLLLGMGGMCPLGSTVVVRRWDAFGVCTA